MSLCLTADRLNSLLLESGLEPLDRPTALRFGTYLELLLKWNRQLNLTAIRTSEEILKRHFLECIFCARNLPPGLSTLLDYGSGGGFPGVPIACCRSDIAVTLGESQGKKSVFLREVVRSLGISSVVYSGRCELLPPSSFGAVALRAVDDMSAAIRVADTLIAPAGWIVLLIGAADVDGYRRELSDYDWRSPVGTPGLDHSVLLMGQRASVPSLN